MCVGKALYPLRFVKDATQEITFAEGTVMEARGLHSDAIYLVVKGVVAIVSLPEEDLKAATGTAEAAAESRSSSGGPEHEFCLEGDMPGMS